MSDELETARSNAQYWLDQAAALEPTPAPPAETPAPEQFGTPFEAPTGPSGEESVKQLFDRLVASGARQEDAQAAVVAQMGGAAIAGDPRFVVQSKPITVMGVEVS
jgi:hypothetical protein